MIGLDDAIRQNADSLAFEMMQAGDHRCRRAVILKIAVEKGRILDRHGLKRCAQPLHIAFGRTADCPADHHPDLAHLRARYGRDAFNRALPVRGAASYGMARHAEYTLVALERQTYEITVCHNHPQHGLRRFRKCQAGDAGRQEVVRQNRQFRCRKGVVLE